MTDITVLGVPTNSAGLVNGVARAPGALRAAGLIETLRTWHDTLDAGDVALPVPRPDRDRDSHLIDPPFLTAMVLATRDAVAEILRSERFPVVLGGDCPLLLGCLAAARAANDAHPIGLLFVDGHEDAYPPEVSVSGEAADMELGVALGQIPAAWDEDLAGVLPVADARNVILLGPRDREEIERQGGPGLGDEVVIIDAETLSVDPAHHARRTAERLAAVPGGFWLHIDLDVLSTEALPAIDYPQPGGITWEALMDVAREALETPGIRGLDVTIYNPDLDPGGGYALRIAAFIAEALSALG